MPDGGMGYGLGMIKGMGVTLRNFFRKPFTVQYPEERNVQAPRFRGEEFTWYVERCTGCASCAKYCPLGIIQIVTSPSGELKQEGDGYKLEKFSIEVSRCMFCGLCVEACPYDALHMGSDFQRSNFVQNKTWIHIDELKNAEKRPSTWFKPHLEAKKYNPQDGKPLPWHEAGREGWRWHQKEKAGAPSVVSTLGPHNVADRGKGSREDHPARNPGPPMDEKQPEVEKNEQPPATMGRDTSK